VQALRTGFGMLQALSVSDVGNATPRMYWSHDATEQGDEADEAWPDRSFAADMARPVSRPEGAVRPLPFRR